MIGFDYSARDGLRIQAYLSLPPQVILQNIFNIKWILLSRPTNKMSDLY